MVVANEGILLDGLTQQKVSCGAAILLDDKVLEHGIVLVHPDLPLFQLFLAINPETKTLKSRFELIKPKNKLITDFAIEVVEATEPTIITPEKKIILNGEG